MGSGLVVGLRDASAIFWLADHFLDESCVILIKSHQQTNTKLFYFSTFSDLHVKTHVALLITK
jgi:hypothetical protein